MSIYFTVPTNYYGANGAKSNYRLIPVYSSTPPTDGSGLVLGGSSYIVGWQESPPLSAPTVVRSSGYSGTSSSSTSSVPTTTTTSATFTINPDADIAESYDNCKDYWEATGQVTIIPIDNQYVRYCFSEVPARPAIPPTPPSPAQTSVNFQEGWNASAQSIQSLLPGKAALFRVINGARGILLGFAPEAWVPSLNTLPFGVMYADGLARVFEMGQFREDLGSFAANQEFMIGRSLDNYIVYINKTDGAQKIRMVHPASANQPVHLFAVLFYGGDSVWI